MPSYQDRIIRTQVQESVVFVEFARDAVETFYAAKHRMPRDNAEAGLPPPKQIFGNYIAQVEIEQGAVNVQFGNRSNHSIVNKWVTLRPGAVVAAKQVPISWLCGVAHPVEGLSYSGTNRTDLETQVLPIDCRL